MIFTYTHTHTLVDKKVFNNIKPWFRIDLLFINLFMFVIQTPSQLWPFLFEVQHSVLLFDGCHFGYLFHLLSNQNVWLSSINVQHLL